MNGVQFIVFKSDNYGSITKVIFYMEGGDGNRTNLIQITYDKCHIKNVTNVSYISFKTDYN